MVLNGLSKFEVSRVKATLHAKLSVSSEICMRLDLRGGLFFHARAVSWNDVCMEQSCWLSKYRGKWFGYAVTRVHFHTWRQPVQPRRAASLPWWLWNVIILMTLQKKEVLGIPIWHDYMAFQRGKISKFKGQKRFLLHYPCILIKPHIVN